MTRELVLVHGRSQQLKDPAALKATWLKALAEGLAKSNLTLPIADDHVHFPFYGDALIGLMKGMDPADAAKVVVKGEDAATEEEQFFADVIEEVRTKKRISAKQVLAVADQQSLERGVRNWGWVQAILEVVDEKVPGASGLTISLATKDVYEYLVTQSIRDEIDEGVASAFTPGAETVVVSHSLGTVVALKVLRRYGDCDGWVVPQMVTVGSPLGISRIRREFSVPRWPQCLGGWFNAMDPRDVVALRPLTPKYFNVGDEHAIVNRTTVENSTANRHGISGYLDDKATAKRIYDALTADD